MQGRREQGGAMGVQGARIPVHARTSSFLGAGIPVCATAPSTSQAFLCMQEPPLFWEQAFLCVQQPPPPLKHSCAPLQMKPYFPPSPDETLPPTFNMMLFGFG